MFGYLNNTLGNYTYNSLFGYQQGMSPYAQNSAGLANQSSISIAQQQYNQAMMQQKPTWVFNGQTCTVREMADNIWPTDCPEKTHFLLRYE